jgi:hypothetical protein
MSPEQGLHPAPNMPNSGEVQAPPTVAQQNIVSGAAASQSASSAPADRKIVATAQIGLEVQNTEKVVADVTAIAQEAGGYVVNANLSRDPKGDMGGTLTVRVPSDVLDRVQSQCEGLGKVMNRQRAANDVTDQYVDLNARLTNLQAAETELRTLAVVPTTFSAFTRSRRWRMGSTGWPRPIRVLRDSPPRTRSP